MSNMWKLCLDGSYEASTDGHIRNGKTTLLETHI